MGRVSSHFISAARLKRWEIGTIATHRRRSSGPNDDGDWRRTARFRSYSPQLGFRLYFSVFILNRVFRKRGFPEDHPAFDYAFCIRCEDCMN
ncbi:hypothetical protein CMV_004252 [Castanea mollissima]|uniref:Uncharacterized protein n=1 Tax=Castanea mollissima TaxID=60419 RepID=A0A8J4RT63_9ROSI|nr:hypothetical protein CMV_004252 [Castanea mollissima]